MDSKRADYQPYTQMTNTQEAAHLQSYHAYKFVRDEGRVSVDLHWKFTQRYFSFPLDPEYLWERLEPVSLAGTKPLIPLLKKPNSLRGF